MPVNPTLSVIRGLIEDITADWFPLISGIRNNTQSTAASSASIDNRLSAMNETIGAIKADTELINTQLGQLQTKVDAISTFAEQTATTLDIFNNNTSANFQALLALLELMNNNASSNAQAIIAATCGDCPDPGQGPINGDGFTCTSDDIATFGSAGNRTSPTDYVISTEVDGEVGDLARVRVNRADLSVSAAGFWNGAVGTSTFIPLDIGGNWVEFEIAETPGHFQITTSDEGFVPFNVTLCVKIQPS